MVQAKLVLNLVNDQLLGLVILHFCILDVSRFAVILSTKFAKSVQTMLIRWIPFGRVNSANQKTVMPFFDFGLSNLTWLSFAKPELFCEIKYLDAQEIEASVQN